jgi:phosphoesterase RecJ-like protein
VSLHAAALRSPLAQAVSVIDGAGALALACHVHPDGDALGSLLAMKHLCEAHGKQVVCSWPEPFVVGPHYGFLPGIGDAVPPSRFPADPPVMITFDLGSFARLGDLANVARHVGETGELVVLDHHSDNERFGTINLVDLDAAATASVVRELAAELGWSLTRDAAICLYAGLVTDTGRFRYPNVNATVFHLAEELASFDIPIPQIEWELFEKHRFAYLRLIGRALDRARIFPECRFVATWCTVADLDEFGVAFDETEGLIDVVRQAAEADVSCVIREALDEGFRVWLRSTGEIDVGALARRFGGGGHWFMAGFVSHEPLNWILDHVEDAVSNLREANPPTVHRT